MSQGNELFNYIETAGDSSRRTRWVLLVMITTCILIFAAFLNSRKANWINARVEVSQKAYNDFDELFARISSADYKKKKLGDLETLEDRAAAFINHYKIKSKTEAEYWLKGYINSKQNYIQIIRVPFIFFTFDVNDLGFISGVSLVFILLFLRFCLWRELTNIKAVFEKAKKDEKCKDQWYTIMSMKQVLTIPPNDIKKEKLWGILLKVIFFIPLIIHSIVAYNDYITKEIAYILSRSNINFLNTANISFISVILILTISCISISIEIDVVWRNENPKKTAKQKETSSKPIEPAAPEKSSQPEKP